MKRWSKERAWQWYEELPWLCGCNYLPRTAVNFTDMWQRETFDPGTMDEELGWAKAAGFNAVRTNPPFIVWRADRDGLMDRLERFLAIAAAHDLRVLPVPLDDCGFSGDEPFLGPQKPPVPGVHNSQAAASPGRDVVMDPSQWGAIEDYISDLVASFGRDPRVLVWDLYNEPGNRMIFRPGETTMFPEALEPNSLALMKRVFEWARRCEPVQPLTVGGWVMPAPWDAAGDPHDHFIDRAAFALSDVVSFHAYCRPDRLTQVVDNLRQHGRPLLCTEWMARLIGSRIDNQLATFRREGIGCFQWGLVKGKTQTNLPWPAVKDRVGNYDEASGEWFHDLLEPDGSPYRSEEVELIRELVHQP